MDDEQTLTSTMKNLRRSDLNLRTSGDLQGSSPKSKRKKAKLCYVKLETNERL